MHKTNSILMRAPVATVFETAANLELWPTILPHYRYIRYLERGPDRNVVVMAATRLGLPISWTSEQVIDREKMEVRFHHLKAFTKGMDVVWTFQETDGWCAGGNRARSAISRKAAGSCSPNRSLASFYPSGGQQNSTMDEGLCGIADTEDTR